MRAAVLDLGTNTFNLLIGELDLNGDLKILFSNKIPVKLGEGGINKGEILAVAYHRGINAIEEHHKTILSFEVEKIKAFGTSALRTAQNGSNFISEIKIRTGIDVEIISGNLEAEYIYYGVRQTLDMGSDKHLILDIGGGSNEFIIADGNKIMWKKSYPLGIARLIERFKPSDPISSVLLKEIDDFLTHELSDLKKIVLRENVVDLVGASGSFETFIAMIHEIRNFNSQTSVVPQSILLEVHDFDGLYEKLIRSNEAERKLMIGLEPMRIEMIVLACHFVKFVVRSLNINKIIQSNFSLKEGAIIQLLNH
jgi:exopolyphosphatase / guanosine-5'-triphosphate,3'-diphosphate pyrophosphatase